MRQTVRLDEVRAPRAPKDDLTRQQVIDCDTASATLDAHYSGVLTQIRALLGAASWREQPAQSVSALSTAQGQATAALSDQAQTLALQSQAYGQLAARLDGLQAQIGTIVQLRAALSAVQGSLQNLSEQAARKSDVAALATQLGQMDGQLSARIDALVRQSAQTATQYADAAARLTALESRAAGYVSQATLRQALLDAYMVDQVLAGTQDHGNLLFRAPTPFVPATLRVSLNGQSLRQGAGGDYIVARSAPGVPYDSIKLLHPEAAPYPRDVLTATYIEAI